MVYKMNKRIKKKIRRDGFYIRGTSVPKTDKEVDHRGSGHGSDIVRDRFIKTLLTYLS